MEMMVGLTKGALEARVCELFTKYHKDMVGKGTQQIRTKWVGEILLIEQDGILTREEQNILTFDSGDLIRSIRRGIFEKYRVQLEQEMEQILDASVTFLAFEVQPDQEKIRVVYSVNINRTTH